MLQGDRDAHLSVERDFRRYEALLAAHPDAAFHLYPGLNHLFMPSPTGAIAEGFARVPAAPGRGFPGDRGYRPLDSGPRGRRMT